MRSGALTSGRRYRPTEVLALHFLGRPGQSPVPSRVPLDSSGRSSTGIETPTYPNVYSSNPAAWAAPNPGNGPDALVTWARACSSTGTSLSAAR